MPIPGKAEVRREVPLAVVPEGALCDDTPSDDGGWLGAAAGEELLGGKWCAERVELQRGHAMRAGAPARRALDAYANATATWRRALAARRRALSEESWSVSHGALMYAGAGPLEPPTSPITR